jgi:hypothetical protein
MTPQPRILWSVLAILAVAAGDSGRAPVSMVESPSGSPPARAEMSPAACSAGATADWWSQVCADLARQEYDPSVSAEGLQAPNRAQNLRTHFQFGHIEVVPRTGGAEPAWRVGLALRRYGRAGAMVDLLPVGPEVVGGRVTYGRPDLAEWYENRPEGLEQGFTVERASAGAGPLRIETDLAGTSLRAERVDERRARFVDPRGAAMLEYGKLAVQDATGRELAAWLDVEEGRIGIVIDDVGARYPITVDPVMTAPAWAVEGQAAGDTYGWSVATAGDVNGDGFSDVIVGGPDYDQIVEGGQAWVYHGSAAGLSTTAAWSAAGDWEYGRFGYSVACAGDVNRDTFADVIVGAPWDEDGEGEAYLYLGSATGLAAEPSWWGGIEGLSLRFGYCVASAGDVNSDGFDDVVIGGPGLDSAFLCLGHAGGLAGPNWSYTGEDGSRVGLSVATAGDVNGDGYADIIVGAPSMPGLMHGRAHLWFGSPSGPGWSQADWTAECDQEDAEFGRSVATAGDVNGDGFADVIIGAPGYDYGLPDRGRAYVYHGSAGGLGSDPTWIAEEWDAWGWMGWSVATAGDVNGDGFADVIVGAAGGEETDDDGAYVYQGSPSGLDTNAIWAIDSDNWEHLGHSVATAGDVNGDGFSDIIVGAPFVDGAGGPDTGRASVYYGYAGGLNVWQQRTIDGGQAGASLGCSAAAAGDVNGDGYGDIVVGAKDYDNGQAEEGRAYVYLGSPAGTQATPQWTKESNQAGARFGDVVARAGDVNGDGYSDIMIGARLWDGGEVNEGSAWVYYGSPSGTELYADWRLESDQAGAYYGSSVGTAGDVNGDGYADVIVGAENGTDGEAYEGLAFVYHGSASGLSMVWDWIAESDQEGAAFGAAVGTAGDVNGDGYSDVIIGAHSYTQVESDEGRVYVYHGSATGLAAVPSWTTRGAQSGAHYGCAVGTAGDVNGDGYSDVIIGADRWDGVGSAEGRAYVFHGNSGGLGLFAPWTAEGGQAHTYFGSAVGTAGDVNGDGYSDVVVGAPQWDHDQVDEGKVSVFHGSSTGALPAADWDEECNQPGAYFGTAVGTAGDVNGDGFSDMLVGAVSFDNPESGEGCVFVYLGNKVDGLDRIARMVRVDDTAPIDVLGVSDSPNSFRLKALGRTAAGRDNVHIECEVKPEGVPFDGTGTVAGFGLDTGAPGPDGSAVPLAVLVSGLAPEGRYHWRIRLASHSPFFPWSSWLSSPYNAMSETDLRMAEGPIAVDEREAPPVQSLLSATTPNPFARATEIAYVLPDKDRVRLAVFDTSGRRVASLIDALQEAGPHRVVWKGEGDGGEALPAGVYLVRLTAGDRIESAKIVRVR